MTKKKLKDGESIIMISFEELEYELPFDDDTPVSHSYITWVQGNAPHEVKLTTEGIKESVRRLSRMKKKEED